MLSFPFWKPVHGFFVGRVLQKKDTQLRRKFMGLRPKSVSHEFYATLIWTLNYDYLQTGQDFNESK